MATSSLSQELITQIPWHEGFSTTSAFKLREEKDLNLADEMTNQELSTKYIRMEGWKGLHSNLKVKAVQHESPRAQERSFKLHYVK